MHYDLVSLDISTGEHKADWFAKVCHSAVLPALCTQTDAQEHDCKQHDSLLLRHVHSYPLLFKVD